LSTVRVGDDKYEFDFANPSVRDARMIEKIFDGTFKEWGQAVRDGSMTALSCLVYVLEKKSGKAVNFDTLDFRLGDFEIIDEAEPAEEAGDDANPTDPTGSPLTVPDA
jgi:hypothetical protein